MLLSEIEDLILQYEYIVSKQPKKGSNNYASIEALNPFLKDQPAQEPKQNVLLEPELNLDQQTNEQEQIDDSIFPKEE